jgi:RNA polymerase-binding transcription factor DksA
MVKKKSDKRNKSKIVAESSKQKVSVKASKGNTGISFPANVLEPIKNFLTGEKDRLEKQQKQITSDDPFSDPDRVNDNAASDDEAAEQIGHVRASALRVQLDRRLVQVRKALTRIKIGKYAICESCGKMIDTDRLMLMPEATKCASCAKKDEA